jgi:hypothetical protein
MPRERGRPGKWEITKPGLLRVVRAVAGDR